MSGTTFARIALSLSVAISPLSAQAACGVPAGFSLPDGNQQRPVRRMSGALLFVSGMRVNTDGAANSYHPQGTAAGALNTICNGIAVTPRSGPLAGVRISATRPTSLSGPQRCQRILDVFRASRDSAWAIGDADIDWFAIAMDGPPLNGRYRPCIQQSGPFRGFFVAQTSRAADPSKDECDPAHWISSTQIPYITLPGNRLAAHGVRVGDLALVHRRFGGTDRLVAAVAADTGNANELGEGSIALHHALGNPTVGRIPGNIAGAVTTFAFPGRRARQPITAASIAAERQALLAALGGEAAVLACLNAP
jgi:hypothetical protein